MRFPLLLSGLFAVVAIAAPGRAAEPPVVRVAVVHEGELLGSETKALANLEKKLIARKLGTVRLGDASPSEKTALAADPTALPDEWRTADVVVLLEILPPEGKRPKRVSRGLGAVAIFHPPAPAPVWRERVEGTVDVGLPEPFQEWLANVVTLLRGAK